VGGILNLYEWEKSEDMVANQSVDMLKGLQMHF